MEQAAATRPEPDPHYERYLSELDDGSLFRYAERSHVGACIYIQRGTAWMKQLDRSTADLMVLMGRLCQRNRIYLDVATAVIGGCNPHAARGEWEGKLFADAWQVLQGEYDDVERRSGPESLRLSECRRPYTRGEKLVTLEALRSVCKQYSGVGWAADRAAHELGCRDLIRQLTGK